MEPKPTEPMSTATGSHSARVTWSPPAKGTRVGRYEVREPLGSGGMGTVVSAWDPELARPVALKFVGKVSSGKEQEMLLREAQAMAQLKHPGVVPVYDVGTWDGRVFLAMELIDGGMNLKDWMEAKPRQPHELVDLLTQVGAALHVAHGTGIVHRDIKPANVLVDRDGRARITDFGVARVGAESGGETPPTAPFSVKGPIGDVTASGRVVGTVGYIAPETLYGALATSAADQFALAVTAWQLLTGVLPFLQTVDATCAEAMATDALKPREAGRVPRRLRRVLVRALRGDPSRRYASMKAFCEALAPPPPTSTRRWVIRILAGMVLIPTYLAFLGYALTRYAMDTLVESCRARAVSSALEVWPPARVMRTVQAHGPRVTSVAEAFVGRWRDASLGACFTKDLRQRPTRVAQAQRDCLDASLLGFDARLVQLEASGATASEVDAQLRELVDPRECTDHWSGESSDVPQWPPN